MDIDRGRARRTAAIHGIGNALATAVYATNWALRRRSGPGRSPGLWPLLLSAVGLGGILYTGWLGGEMVYRYGVGFTPAEEEPPAEQQAMEPQRQRELAGTV